MIDATGKYVFPGFVDPHVHIYLPFMGTAAKDTHETASRAALIGGTRTLIEMICPARNEKPLEAFELWLGEAQGNSACDFTFHMGVARYEDEAERDFEIVRRGLSSFKVFFAYKGAFGVSDEELYKTLQLAKRLGVITTVHCENADLVLELQQKLLAERKTGPEYHYWSRPPIVEAEGANVPALMRAFVACGWFGIQTWIGGAAIYKIVSVFEPAFSAPGAATFLGITFAEYLCFLFFWAINMFVVYKGIESIRLLLNMKAPLLIVLGLALLAWAYQAAGGFGPILSQPSAFAAGQPKAGQFMAFFIPGLHDAKKLSS